MLTDVLILLVGVVVGAMNAIAGGGMLIGIPVMIALGAPPLVANVTAYTITPPGMITAIVQYRDYLRKVPWRYALLLIPIAIGGLAGALVLKNTGADNFASLVPWLVLFGVILFAAQPFIHVYLHHHIHHKHTHLRPLYLIGAAMLPTAFYGGYFGAGFGFMMMAFLGMGRIHEIHMLNAMKNIAGTLIAVITLVVMGTAGYIDWHFAVVMGIGSAIGGIVGARMAKRVSSHWLRIIVVVIGLVSAAYLALAYSH